MATPTNQPLWQLDHLSINAAPDAKGLAALTHILGLHGGFRPPFPFPGSWLYSGYAALLHVIDNTENEVLASGLQFNHIALRADVAASEVLRRIAEASLKHYATRIPESETVQIFIRVGDGLMIELDVPARPDDAPVTPYPSQHDVHPKEIAK